ncbi:hypothetical protein PLESTB_000943500 [Pleodorina starrii]|uniref:Uncharacterized protein n=1 Tax=Pleodorina starrii TaxID=330485 RepID=A0A9W6BN49_9CHLO|nr:hypothetical protein PLESTB_000943500 [Pleodorina starrii]GLC71148.1 hypothetical protein PLESTF_001079700 [Pleodorina starrii]
MRRFQIQGSVLESTCGAPIIVVLVRYRHDPESGLSRECQRAQFAPGAAWFAVKAIVVPADQVLSYMDQPLLQQPRLVDSQGRNLLGGPDVSPDGCIYATPLEKNGIAHLNNFCLMQPYTGQEEPAAASGSGMGLGLQPQHSGGSGHGPEATRRVRTMLGNDGGALSCGGLGDGSEVIQDSADVLSASSELCLLVQLLRRDVHRPGRWFAYDMPHLISRPFQVVPRSALLAMQQPLGSGSPQLLPCEQMQALVAQGRGLSTPRHSAGMGLGLTPGGRDVMPVHPHPFMSPQYRRHQSAGGALGAVPTAGLAAYGTGPGLPSRMGVIGAPQQLQPQECVAPGFGFGASEPMGSMALGMGMGAGMGMGVGMGMGMGMDAAPGALPVGCSVGCGPAAWGGAAAGAGFGAPERSGGGGQQSSMSTESPSGGAGSQRAPRARRRSCLSKDSSHDDSSVGGATMAASGSAAAAVAGLRTPSITSGMKPSNSGLLRGGSGAAAPLMAAAMAASATAAGLGTAASCAAPSPPISPPPPRVVHALGPGAAPPLPAAATGVLDVMGAPAFLRSSEEGCPLPLALRQAPSATLLDMNISDLLNDIQPQPLLTEDIMELEEGAPKRVRSNLISSGVGALTSENNNSGSSQLLAAAAAGSPRCAVSPPHLQVESGLCRGGAGGGAHAAGELRSGGGGEYGQAREGHHQPSRTDSWSVEMSQEQVLNLRTQSTGFSGTHASSFATANGSNPCAGAAAAAVAVAASNGGVGGGGSCGSSASQLDLLVQLLGQPGAMQDALDRMEQEQQRQQGQRPQQVFEGVLQPQDGGREDMQV